MKLTMIESPYASADPAIVERNMAYLHDAIMDSFSRGESPFASHGFYTRYLDDKDPEQRRLGISAGNDWARKADLIAVYADFGVTDGMKERIDLATDLGIKIEYRSCPEWREAYEKNKRSGFARSRVQS